MSQNSSTYQLLFNTIESGNFEEFQRVLDKITSSPDYDPAKSILNTPGDTYRWTPLMACCFYLNRINMLEALLKLDCDPNGTDESGDFPLLVASERNNVDAVSTLMLFKADINKTAQDQMTCLHMAISKNNFEVLEALLLYDPEMSIKDSTGLTPLEFAQQTPCNPAIITALESSSGDSTRSATIGAANMLQGIKQAVKNELCTITVTKETFVRQLYWICHDCTEDPASPFGVCESCLSICHRNHKVTAKPARRFYCDCGLHDDCSALPTSIRSATEEQLQEYKIALRAILVDHVVTPDESTMLFNLKMKYHITDEQHVACLQEVGLTEEEYNAAHKTLIEAVAGSSSSNTNTPTANSGATGSSSGDPVLDELEADHRQKMSHKIALLVGISAYKQSGASLKNPKNDVRAANEILKRLGFDTEVVIDIATYDEFSEVVNKFIKKLRAIQNKGDYNCVGFFFFAGHAVEIKGSNYLLHGDFTSDDMASQGYESKTAGEELLDGYMSSQYILKCMENACNTNIMVLDACRNNPFAPPPKVKKVGKGSSGAVKKSGSNLVPPYPTGCSLVLLSTAPGFVAGDGSDENKDNGMFTNSLLKHLGNKDIDIEEIAYRTARDVYIVSKGKQHPWRHSALIRKIYLADPVTPKPE